MFSLNLPLMLKSVKWADDRSVTKNDNGELVDPGAGYVRRNGQVKGAYNTHLLTRERCVLRDDRKGQ